SAMIDEILREVDGKRVAVLAGGQSGEREVSFRSGGGVLEALQEADMDAVMVDPRPDLASQLREAGADVVFNALHGGAGENGQVQGVLEMARIPYTGCGVLASALTMDKVLTKAVLRDTGLPTPDSAVLFDDCDDETIDAAIGSVGLPVVVKPSSEGSSLGVEICRRRQDARAAVESLLTEYPKIICEKYIDGTEITVGILGCGEQTRPLPVLEIVPKKQFYDYEAKYTAGMTDLICPARIPDEQAEEAQRVALQAHRVTGCHGISRCDMHVDTGGNVWAHEINSMPGLTETSDVPHEADAAGISYRDLVLEILYSAFCRQ
ncbi:MAG: D-alanine--D-alanine ligase, partial [Armatimonadota bacterium]